MNIIYDKPDIIDETKKPTSNPSIQIAPNHLDFGKLLPGARQMQEFQVNYVGAENPRISISYSEPNSWFKLMSVERVTAAQPFPLNVRVLANTQLLPPGRNYDGWLAVHAGQSKSYITVSVQVVQPRQLRHFFSRRAFRLPLLLLAAALVGLGFAFLPFAFKPIPLTPSSVPLATVTEPSPIAHTASAQGRLLFVSDENGQPMLFLSQADGGEQQSLQINGGSPVWSPRADEFIFIGKDGTGASQIYLARLGDTTPRQLTNTPTEKSVPTWSPDGKTVGFLAVVAEQRRLQLLDLQQPLTQTTTLPSGDQQPPSQANPIIPLKTILPDLNELGPDGETHAFSWSSDGQTLLFDLHNAAGRQIYRSDTEGVEHFGEPDSWEPVWSPDGERIAVTRAAGIFVMDHQGENLQQLTTFPAWSPRWSPDGQQIAFLSSQDSPQDSADLWLMAADGQQQRRLTTTGCLDFVWSSNRNQLAYTTGPLQGESPTLYLWVLTPGSEPHLLAEVSEPHVSWQ